MLYHILDAGSLPPLVSVKAAPVLRAASPFPPTLILGYTR